MVDTSTTAETDNRQPTWPREEISAVSHVESSKAETTQPESMPVTKVMSTPSSSLRNAFIVTCVCVI